MQVPQHMFFATNCTCLCSTMYRLNVFTTKHISILVLTKYIKDLINYLYIVGSTKYEYESLKSFIFITIGVAMDLQSIILNLCRISTIYFPWLRKISSGLYHTSNPKKQCIKLRSFILNSKVISLLHPSMSFSSPVRNRSSTYRTKINGKPSSTL
jgi:hypothetical protein